jgi:hypothetical protein
MHGGGFLREQRNPEARVARVDPVLRHDEVLDAHGESIGCQIHDAAGHFGGHTEVRHGKRKGIEDIAQVTIADVAVALANRSFV